MRTPSLLLASLLVALYGCQPETPAQQTTAPAAEPSATPAPAEAPAAMTPASEPAAAQPAEAAPAVTPVPAKKPEAAAKSPAAATSAAKPAPAQAVATPAAKVETAPAPATTAATAAVAPAKAVLSEADALALAKKNGCLVCHSIDKKVVGPAWKDVAAKYRGDAGAEARLADKIAKGGSGVWGAVAMPSNPRLGEADRQALARFVLSLK